MTEKKPAPPKRLTEAESDFLRWMDEIELENRAELATSDSQRSERADKKPTRPDGPKPKSP